MTTRPLVALTGATGFLGVHLVRALDAEGFRVRVLARRAPSPPGWGTVEPEVAAGDLSDQAALAALVEGADAVVHNAGVIKAADAQAFMAVNRDGTARLARLARERAPAASFLLVSSLAARHPELSAYARSKRAGEEAAAAVFGESLTVARPPAIYGPGDRETFAVFRAAAASPFLPAPATPARFALIHVEDAAGAIARLARAPQPGAWTLADARPAGYGWREILAAAAAAVDRQPRFIPVPGWGFGAALRLGALAGVLAPDKLGELLHTDWAVRPHELAPDPPRARWDLAEGFAATAQWYRREGWLG